MKPRVRKIKKYRRYSEEFQGTMSMKVTVNARELSIQPIFCQHLIYK